MKQSRHWFIDWSMKLCWLLIIFQSDATSDHGHISLVSNKHVPACRCLEALVHWCTWFLCSQGLSEWCIELLLWCLAARKQLLSYICQAAGDFYFPVHHAYTRAPSCCDTRLRTSHQTMRPPNRPDLNPVDYGIWTVIQECIYQKQQWSPCVINSCG